MPHDSTVTAWHFRRDAVRARDGGQVWALRLEGQSSRDIVPSLGPQELEVADHKKTGSKKEDK